MLFAREILLKLNKVLKREEFIILTGARQVGKTHILLLLKEKLEKQGEICHFFNLENLETVKKLDEHPYNIFELIPERKSRQYVFIDEIQYLKNPSNFLKLLYDEKREQIRIIATGSSSFYIDRKFQDSLMGRKFLFEVYGLSFREYLDFNNEHKLLSLTGKKKTLFYQKRIKELFLEYITYGAYPKVALAQDKDMKKILLEEIATSFLKKDIKEAGLRDSEKYFAILKILADQSGQLLNLEKLAKLLSLNRATIEEYIYVMRKSYQISIIRPYHRNLRKELNKMPKVFFNDLGLRNIFLNDFSNIEEKYNNGAYLENIYFREFLLSYGLDKIKFWRTQNGQEVDFVINEKDAFEIKMKKNTVKMSKYKSFVEKYPNIKFSVLDYQDMIDGISNNYVIGY